MTEKTGIIIQARIGSTRLPNKVMKDLGGKPVLEWVFERCKLANVDEVIIATSIKKENDVIEKFCKSRNINFFRGSEEDVLERFYEAARKYNFSTIIRVTGDCPLISPEIINTALADFQKSRVDYLSNSVRRSYPRGFDVEVLSFGVLEKANKFAKKKPEREHVTSFIYGHPDKFKLGYLVAKSWLNRPEMRLCLDTEDDFKLLKIIYDKLKINEHTPVKEIVKFLEQNPKLVVLNNKSEIEQRSKNKEEGIKQKIIR
ncbi:MAG: glycosyltransferase family protein [Nanoarchaeota archaeon]